MPLVLVAEAKDKYPVVHRIVPVTKNHLVQNVSSAFSRSPDLEGGSLEC